MLWFKGVFSKSWGVNEELEESRSIASSVPIDTVPTRTWRYTQHILATIDELESRKSQGKIHLDTQTVEVQENVLTHMLGPRGRSKEDSLALSDSLPPARMQSALFDQALDAGNRGDDLLQIVLRDEEGVDDDEIKLDDGVAVPPITKKDSTSSTSKRRWSWSKRNSSGGAQ